MSKPKQKTAIRQLIEKFKESIEIYTNAANNAGKPSQYIRNIECLKEAIKEAESLEPVNEQQIIEAHISGKDMMGIPNITNKPSKDWFNETFEKP